MTEMMGACTPALQQEPFARHLRNGILHHLRRRLRQVEGFLNQLRDCINRVCAVAEFQNQSRGGIQIMHAILFGFVDDVAIVGLLDIEPIDMFRLFLHDLGGFSSVGSVRMLCQPILVRLLEMPDRVLVLTPLKDAADCLEGYCARLSTLTYPHHRISLGFLESDSVDETWAELNRHAEDLKRRFRSVTLWRKDFGYRIPAGIHRGAESIQMERRAVLAKSRNHLLFHALDDEDWVLWLDVDVIEYPPDLIERLLAAGRDIVHAHCVLDFGGPTHDRNAWRDRGRVHLDDLRGTGDLVELDAVGGTVLFIRADLHRDGLIFPPFPYGLANPAAREGRGEIETEGLGLMAHDMGHRCWGMPNFEVRHGRW